MIQRILSVLALGALLAAATSAQDCSQLSLSTELDPALPLQTLTIQLEGSTPGAPVVLAFGPNAGETILGRAPLGPLVLGLDRPFTTRLMGVADENGDLDRAATIPSDLGITFYVQAIGIEVTSMRPERPSLAFCTSNVASIDL